MATVNVNSGSNTTLYAAAQPTNYVLLQNAGPGTLTFYANTDTYASTLQAGNSILLGRNTYGVSKIVGNNGGGANCAADTAIVLG